MPVREGLSPFGVYPLAVGRGLRVPPQVASPRRLRMVCYSRRGGH